MGRPSDGPITSPEQVRDRRAARRIAQREDLYERIEAGLRVMVEGDGRYQRINLERAHQPFVTEVTLAYREAGWDNIQHDQATGDLIFGLPEKGGAEQ